MNNVENSEKIVETKTDSGNYRKIIVNKLKMPPNTEVNPPGSPKPMRAATPAEQYAFYYDQVRPKRYKKCEGLLSYPLLILRTDV